MRADGKGGDEEDHDDRDVVVDEEEKIDRPTAS